MVTLVLPAALTMVGAVGAVVSLIHVAWAADGNGVCTPRSSIPTRQTVISPSGRPAMLFVTSVVDAMGLTL